MTSTQSSTLPEGTAQTVSTYLLQNTAFGEGMRYWPSDSFGTAPLVTYSFSSDWSQAEQAGAALAFADWSYLTNISFKQESNGGEISISKITPNRAYETDNTADVGYGPISSATISIDTASFGDPGTIGDYGFTTTIHEIGHALGLGHGGAYNAGSDPDPDLPDPPDYYLKGTMFLSDTRQYTIMSYNDQVLTGANTTIDGTTYYDQSPMLYDIYAIQRLYGTPAVDMSGTTTFGFNASADIPSVFNFAVNAHPVLTLYSRTGHNTLDLSGFSTDSTVDLNPGTFSSVAGMTDNIAMYYTTAVDRLILGGGHNVAVANADDNDIVGGQGSNRIYLGAGNDSVDSSGTDLIIGGTGSATVSAHGAAEMFGGDGLLSFVNGAGRSTIVGGSGITDVNGGTGSVTVWGGAGPALVSGGRAGNNLLTAGTSSANIFGGGANDMLTAGTAKGTTLVAGSGNETLLGSAAGGDADLFGGSGSDLIAAGAGSDSVILGTGNATVYGGAGNSSIFAGSGNAVVIGGQGSDYVQFGSGAVTAFAGPGADLFGFAAGKAGGITDIVNFQVGTDHIALQGYGADAASTALQHATVSGGNTVISLDDGTRILLVGVTSIGGGSFA